MTARSSASSARSRSGPSGGTPQPFDARAAGGQFLLDPFVAAIEMIDTVDDRLAAGNETRDHQRYGSAQIGRHDRRAGQPRYATHQRGGAVDIDIRAHPHQ